MLFKFEPPSDPIKAGMTADYRHKTGRLILKPITTSLPPDLILALLLELDAAMPKMCHAKPLPPQINQESYKGQVSQLQSIMQCLGI